MSAKYKTYDDKFKTYDAKSHTYKAKFGPLLYMKVYECLFY